MHLDLPVQETPYRAPLRFPTLRNERRRKAKARKYPEGLPLIGDVPPTVYIDFTSELFWYNGSSFTFSNWLSAINGTFSRSSSAYYTNSSGNLAQASSGVIRDQDFDPIALTSKGALLEGSSTNLVLQSNTFSNASWNLNVGTSVAQNVTGPDAVANSAWTVTDSVATSLHRVAQGVTFSASTTYTFSLYVKYTNHQYVYLLQFDGNTVFPYSVFDLINGVVTQIGTTGSPSATITPLANGWFRITQTATTSSGATSGRIELGFSNGATYSGGSFAGTGTDTFDAWGAQLEQLAFASSYIPTTTATATRSADSLTATPISAWYNSAQGVIYASSDQEGFENGLSFTSVAIDDGTTNNRIILYNNTQSNASSGLVVSGGVGSFAPYPGDPNQQVSVINVRTVAAMSSAASNFVYVKDGGAIDTTGSAGPMPVGVNKLGIGVNSFGQQINGHISQIGYWPIAATGAQLQVLTAPPSWVPTAVGVLPTIFADFAGGNYMFNGYVQPSLSTWESQIKATFSRGSSAYYTNSSGLLASASSNVLRFDYDPVTLASRGILMEDTSTNTWTHSQDNTNWTAVNQGSVAGNVIAAPDGTITASSFTESSVAGIQRAFNPTDGANVPAANTTSTLSIYFKPVSRTWIQVNFQDGYQNFNFSGAGSLGSSGGSKPPTSASISQLANGWYRAAMVWVANFQGPINSISITSMPSDIASEAPSTTGNGLLSFYWWGVQIEQLGFASSYIATTTTTASRSADVFTHNSQSIPNTAYVETINAASGDVRTCPLITVGGGGSNYNVPLRTPTNPAKGETTNITNGAQGLPAFGVSGWANRHKMAISGGTTGTIAAAADSVSSTSFTGSLYTSGLVPTTISIASDQYYGTSGGLYGDIMQLGFWNVAATASQMATITTL